MPLYIRLIRSRRTSNGSKQRITLLLNLPRKQSKRNPDWCPVLEYAFFVQTCELPEDMVGASAEYRGRVIASKLSQLADPHFTKAWNTSITAGGRFCLMTCFKPTAR